MFIKNNTPTNKENKNQDENNKLKLGLLGAGGALLTGGLGYLLLKNNKKSLKTPSLSTPVKNAVTSDPSPNIDYLKRITEQFGISEDSYENFRSSMDRLIKNNDDYRTLVDTLKRDKGIEEIELASRKVMSDVFQRLNDPMENPSTRKTLEQFFSQVKLPLGRGFYVNARMSPEEIKRVIDDYNRQVFFNRGSGMLNHKDYIAKIEQLKRNYIEAIKNRTVKKSKLRQAFFFNSKHNNGIPLRRYDNETWFERIKKLPFTSSPVERIDRLEIMNMDNPYYKKQDLLTDMRDIWDMHKTYPSGRNEINTAIKELMNTEDFNSPIISTYQILSTNARELADASYDLSIIPTSGKDFLEEANRYTRIRKTTSRMYSDKVKALTRYYMEKGMEEKKAKKAALATIHYMYAKIKEADSKKHVLYSSRRMGMDKSLKLNPKEVNMRGYLVEYSSI